MSDYVAPESSLWLGDKLVWRNPAGLGHAFIKLRKQIREQELCEIIGERMSVAREGRLVSAAIASSQERWDVY